MSIPCGNYLGSLPNLSRLHCYTTVWEGIIISKVPTLLFLPGTLCTEATFAYQGQHLTDCAKVQIVPLWQGSSTAVLAQWILEQVTEPFALVGFSQGAIVALEIMRLAPERVTKLCLMSANPREATSKQLETWQIWQQEVREGKFNDVIQGFTNNVHPEKRSDLKLHETILKMAHDTGPDIFATQLQALASRIDSRPHLHNIHRPTLLLVGRQDTVTPLEFHLEMQTLIPHAALVPVEDCGHYLTLEQPQTVTALLRSWLHS